VAGQGARSRAGHHRRPLATRQANGQIGWAPQLRELPAFVKVAKILGLDAAVANSPTGEPFT
jgi:hypothetical protein